MVTDLVKRTLKRVIQQKPIVKRQMWKLKDSETRRRWKERVTELVNTEAQDLWKSFKNGILQACDEVCGKKRGRKDRGNTWWWNVEVKDAITRKKAAYTELCKCRSEENKTRYRVEVCSSKLFATFSSG